MSLFPLSQPIPSFALILAVWLGATTPACAADAASPTWDEAGATYQKGDWKASAAAYGAIVKREPRNGRAWYRLGTSYAKLGQFKDAIAAYTKADSSGQNPRVRYSIACVYARMNDSTLAFACLDKAAAAGFRGSQAMKEDSDLDGLRGTPHFAALVQRVERNDRPCAYAAENRQFDFWVGEWDVRTPDGTPRGLSSITVENGNCWIHEHWTSLIEGKGESINFYNSTTQKWHQTWVDDQGGLAEFDGGLKNGAMVLEGYRQEGSKDRLPARLTLTPLPDGAVRQLGEYSNDGGKTWIVEYDFRYTHKAGTADARPKG